MTAPNLLLLALFGLLVALPVLAYVARRGGDVHARLAWVTAFLALDLIMFGGFTRLTDSGLGCPDWPGCYGHSNPLSAAEHIRAAETAMPSGPVTRIKAWIEMLHRYFAMGVGLLIIVLMVQAWLRARRDPSRSPWLATVIFLAVCVQGAFGAFTVTMKLTPAIVTLHLLGGMLLLALLTGLALREGPRPAVGAEAVALRGHGLLAAVVLVLQIALGGWVSTNYAVLACPDFPLCHGHWWPPEMDFHHAYTLWRPLGQTADGDLIPFQSLVAIHWVHRNFAYLVLAVLGTLAWRARSVPGLARWARALAGLILLQFLTGLSNVMLQWPLPVAVLHNGGAALLVMMLVVLHFRVGVGARHNPAQTG
ncbi:COX15/CtaA family protein [Thiobacter aerophilum]|uniref:COX15/CtaA family protein n=1 Tax=Thiobacter aerophilum TaxID=3121275 RepID=A0ABV0EE99_9BURK